MYSNTTLLPTKHVFHLNRALARADARCMPWELTGRPSTARLCTCSCMTWLLLPPGLRSNRRTPEALSRMRAVVVCEVLATAVNNLAAPLRFARRKHRYRWRRNSLASTLDAHVTVRVVATVDYRATTHILLCWSKRIANLHVVLWVPMPATYTTQPSSHRLGVNAAWESTLQIISADALSSQPCDAMK